VRILVTGKDGQVARSLAERAMARPDVDLVFVGRPELDLAVPGRLGRAIAEIAPDAVVNAAAYTAVDKAEEQEELAFRINADAAGDGAEAAAVLAIPFIQMSTDYVFAGEGTRPWREDDPVAPINAYGRTKAEGERRVLAASPLHAVVRTSWVISPFGHNFVKTMLKLARERREIAVVADQRGSPTSALDLADAILAFAQRSLAGDATGIWHLAGAGDASWADVATHVMAISAACGGPSAEIRSITSGDYPTLSKRPANSVLDCSKARELLRIELPDYEGSMASIVRRLVEAGDGPPVR
jgi:dTDP-4-dehydrorhamnose reductase